MGNTLAQLAKTFARAGVSQYASAEFIEALADRIEELEAENERLRLALEETVSLLWDDMSKQESVGKHGGYIYMKCRAALAMA